MKLRKGSKVKATFFPSERSKGCEVVGELDTWGKQRQEFTLFDRKNRQIYDPIKVKDIKERIRY